MTAKLFLLLLFLNGLLPNNQQTIKTDIILVNSKIYVSAIELSNNIGIEHFFNKDKEKLVLKFKGTRVVVSPHNKFIIVDDKAYSMPHRVIYDGNDFLVPALYFINILKENKINYLSIDTNEKFVVALRERKNIFDFNINKKLNGMEISINASQEFDTNDISSSVSRSGWINVTVLNGKIDSLKFLQSPLQPPIQKILSRQFEESCQISFLLKNNLKNDPEIQTTKDKINIILRTSFEEKTNDMKKIKDNWFVDCIVIDPGHGGKDPGAVSRNGKIKEKDIALDISKRLGKKISKQLGVKTILTRSEDVFIPLWRRTEIANDSKGKLFISIHVNATPHSTKVKGFETFLLRPGKNDDAIDVAERENSVIDMETKNNKYKKISYENIIVATMAQQSFVEDSEFMAYSIQNELDKVITSPNRGIKQAGFHVLIGASMPNVLVEVGFISNFQEAKLLNTSSYREKIAEAIFNAVIDFKEKVESPLINN